MLLDYEYFNELWSYGGGHPMLDITCVSLYGCLSLACFSQISSTPIHPCISDARTIDMWRVRESVDYEDDRNKLDLDRCFGGREQYKWLYNLSPYGNLNLGVVLPTSIQLTCSVQCTTVGRLIFHKWTHSCSLVTFVVSNTSNLLLKGACPSDRKGNSSQTRKQLHRPVRRYWGAREVGDISADRPAK